MKRDDLPKSRRIINLNGVVVGQIKSIRPHLNANDIRLASVDVGTGQTYQVIFGGPAVEKIESKVAVALPETKTDDGKLKKQKFRGEWSEAMLCSAIELGFLEEGPDEILILPDNLKVGTPIKQYWKEISLLKQN